MAFLLLSTDTVSGLPQSYNRLKFMEFSSPAMPFKWEYAAKAPVAAGVYTVDMAMESTYLFLPKLPGRELGGQSSGGGGNQGTSFHFSAGWRANYVRLLCTGIYVLKDDIAHESGFDRVSVHGRKEDRYGPLWINPGGVCA